MNVQLRIAFSDISCTSGQAIIRALLAGQRAPKTLAALRDPRCMASEEEIVHSLQGVWKPDVLFELQQAVDAYDFYRQQMAKCDEQLKRYMALLPARKVKQWSHRPSRRPPPTGVKPPLHASLESLRGTNPRLIWRRN